MNARKEQTMKKVLKALIECSKEGGCATGSEVGRCAGVEFSTARDSLNELIMSGKVVRTRKSCGILYFVKKPVVDLGL